MKEILNLPAIIKYQGKLCEVIGYAEEKVVFLREIRVPPCEKCGEVKEYAEVESSPNFQSRAEKVNTLSE
jgi:hypothetical protein